MKRPIVLTALLGLAATPAFAQQGPHRGPPAEALAACAGLTEGAACSFTHDSRALTGTCRTSPDGAALACRPAHGPGGRGGHPPQEALDACSGKSDGVACAFNHGGNAIAGTCRPGPNGEVAACAPARGERRAPPPEAAAACSGKAESDACSVTLRGQALTGTCRKGPGGEAVACMPAGRGRPPHAP